MNNLINDSLDKEQTLTIYFDASSIELFEVWILQNKTLRDRLAQSIDDGSIEVTLFMEHLKSTAGRKYEYWREFFESIQFVFDESKWDKNCDELYTAELQTIYFHDERPELSRSHAEFLVLARNAARNQPSLHIMTVHPSFQRVVNADVTYISKPHGTKIPANFNLYSDLQLHPRLSQVVSSQLANDDYIGAVQAGVMELFGFLREQHPDLANPKKLDGWNLVSKALGYKGIVYNLDKKANDKLPDKPIVKLNAFDGGFQGSDVNEQRGYFNFFGGTYSAFRNIINHEEPTSPARLRRFDDEKVAIKIICFLSLLFEKLEESKSYNL